MPPGSQQQGQQDNHMAPLWIMVGIFVAIGLVWYFFKSQILGAFFYVKLKEIDLISSIYPSASLQAAKELILTNLPTNISFRGIVFIANAVGNLIAIPVAVIMLIFIFLLFRRSASRRFRQTYSMKSLLKLENSVWPQTSPILSVDLLSQDLDQGPWAMAIQPMPFAKKYKLLKAERKSPGEGMLSSDIRWEVSIVKPKALQVFSRQLGPVWHGTDALNMHTKALYTVFAARIGGDIDEARSLLYQIAASSKTKKLNFSGVKELLDKHRNNKLVMQIADRHAFILTVMASMLEASRAVGVQASADFLWLKPIDRRLWFMLNAIGRQTPTVEVAGPFAHWVVEKQLQRKIVTPMVDNAVDALEEALQEVIYKPDEDEKQ